MIALPDYGAALGRALKGIAAIVDPETVALSEAAGRVLREPVVADRDLPPFDRAQMDGYALRGGELGRIGAFPVVATIAAGRPADVSVPPGQCVAIATGAPLPADVDTVIPHEQSDRGDPVHFAIDSIAVGHAVHRRGVDASEGDTLVEAGTVLAAQHLGIAAVVGLAAVVTVRRPRATVLTSGDEVVAMGAPVKAHQIRNSNGTMVTELLRRIGAEPVAHHHVVDELDDTVTAVGQALAASDLVVTVGGISAGDRDHFPAAFERQGVTLALRGAAIQPGRPILVGHGPQGQVVLGLPGNPVSALACMCLFGWPIARAQLGLDPQLPWRTVQLAEPVRPNPRRRAFRPGIANGPDRITIPKWAGSGDLAHTAPTAGLVELPVQDHDVEAGTAVRFLGWP